MRDYPSLMVRGDRVNSLGIAMEVVIICIALGGLGAVLALAFKAFA